MSKNKKGRRSQTLLHIMYNGKVTVKNNLVKPSYLVFEENSAARVEEKSGQHHSTVVALKALLNDRLFLMQLWETFIQ